MRKINDGLTNNQRCLLRHPEKRVQYAVKRKEWRLKNREKVREYCRNWEKKNPEKRKLLQEQSHRNRKERISQLRTQIFILLGNKCANKNCPISLVKMDNRALQIDHVRGGGNKERNSFNRNDELYLKAILSKIMNGSKEYQLLCAYCNWMKRMGSQGNGNKDNES